LINIKDRFIIAIRADYDSKKEEEENEIKKIEEFKKEQERRKLEEIKEFEEMEKLKQLRDQFALDESDKPTECSPIIKRLNNCALNITINPNDTIPSDIKDIAEQFKQLPILKRLLDLMIQLLWNVKIN